jgi:hypothetical protein
MHQSCLQLMRSTHGLCNDKKTRNLEVPHLASDFIWIIGKTFGPDFATRIRIIIANLTPKITIFFKIRTLERPRRALSRESSMLYILKEPLVHIRIQPQNYKC